MVTDIKRTMAHSSIVAEADVVVECDKDLIAIVIVQCNQNAGVGRRQFFFSMSECCACKGDEECQSAREFHGTIHDIFSWEPN